MHNISFRKARAEELDTVLGLLQEAALWLQEKNIEYWRDWLTPSPALVEWIKEGFDRSEFFIVEGCGEVIGCFRLQWEDRLFWGKMNDEAGYLHSFTISRRFAGAGIGKRVLALIESYCRENGKQYLRLDCGKENAALCKYYEELGFRRVGEISIVTDKLVQHEKRL